jgi:hypothetical protein
VCAILNLSIKARDMWSSCSRSKDTFPDEGQTVVEASQHQQLNFELGRLHELLLFFYSVDVVTVVLILSRLLPVLLQ